MKGVGVGCALLLGGCLAGGVVWRVAPVRAAGAVESRKGGWDRQAAARYLDGREVWWQQWAPAQKERGTVCISCHTTVPYAMARPGLGRALGEAGMTAPEKAMRASVDKRVMQWAEMVPFYSDERNGVGKTAESHATEAVMNAVVLASYDARLGHVRAVTRKAFANAWALQETSGANAGGWRWQDFHLAPWESGESAYQGAALLMVAAVNAPGGFAGEAGMREHRDAVRGYLRRGYARQPLLNRVYVLWASGKEDGLLTAAERASVVAELRAAEQEDGGWRMAAMEVRERGDKTAQPSASDGYATGLVVLALEGSGVGRRDTTVVRGVGWLAQHQMKDGSWAAASMNKERDPESDAYLFMTDAATGYAALALENAR
jgi:squalene-hopene/tetraprenyl-beta-curcumene cyclase